MAAKHRQVQVVDPNFNKYNFNEKYENPTVGDFDNGDYQRGPEVYLNPPQIHRDLEPQQKELYVPKQILVHLDLKGAPPKMEFLLDFLKQIKNWGATGILLEYEDMFPFEGMLKDVSASNHYNKSDIFNILIKSKELGLEVIPLVQTFGHMEFILKHGQFAHLRDNSLMPESICPCHQQSMSLIGLYIDQVMALHKDSIKHLHIGCDEVFHLGECSSCASKPRTDVFVNHVANVAKYVKNKYPQIESVIIWDDMLRNMMSAEMLPLQVIEICQNYNGLKQYQIVSSKVNKGVVNKSGKI